MTRDGMNGISASATTPGRHAASVSTSAASTMPPPRVAEQVLEQDPDGDGQRVTRRHVLDGVQPIDVRQPRAEGRPSAEGIVR